MYHNGVQSNINIVIVQFCGSVAVYAAFSLFIFASFAVVFSVAFRMQLKSGSRILTLKV